MKIDRQTKILEIIAQNDIETQGQLMQALAEAGLRVTQATVSRDIKQLRLVKRAGPYGVLRYEVSEPTDRPEFSSKLETIFRESVIHCSCAQNIVVIKTLPGLASAACAAIDKMNVTSIVGSLAGDDTAFIAMRDSVAASLFCDEMQKRLR